MIIKKANDRFVEDAVNANLENHCRKQTSTGKSIRSTVVTGTQLNNWTYSAKTNTLLHELIAIESTMKKLSNERIYFLSW